MARTIAFVPVRCGSKSIPLKNIKEFCGKPLVFWVLNAIEETPNIDTAIVATDCEQIKAVIQSFAFSKVSVYDRLPDNAHDTSSTESVMLEFLEYSDAKNEDKFILVQATCPLTQSLDLTRALELLEKDNSFESLLSCVRVKRFFWNVEGPINYDFRHRPRRQDFDGVLMENGAFYINTVGNIRRDKNRLSGKVKIYEMPEYAAVDIDEPDDWTQAEAIMKKYILDKSYER
jgi:CMP-N-acetylneuraminic acid synthetase